MNTQPVSDEDREIARKNAERMYSEALRRLATITQERAADFMGVSASTISRDKEALEKACHLLSALGFQLAQGDSMVISQMELSAYEMMAFKYLQSKINTRHW
ncbi:CII family transcriptional regulator [Paenalcaligenes suwonensis]|uniref:CII family transcriptional regulator n=1 Tax=Paenalcaligenes suwonensis TaxID=1202713 RepID=UPI00140C2A32|nr:CII family transcriptional regulator [Paenalcaligenes suwonensis]NHC63195.1 MarR family transcriptional regulator [Paenalcaligenes suwonensis]